jgi:hypothetical protein
MSMYLTIGGRLFTMQPRLAWRTIYIVAAWKRILKVVVLDFDDEVRETHMKVMRGIWTEYLWMYEDPTMIPDSFKNASLGYIGNFKDL